LALSLEVFGGTAGGRIGIIKTPSSKRSLVVSRVIHSSFRMIGTMAVWLTPVSKPAWLSDLI